MEIKNQFKPQARSHKLIVQQLPDELLVYDQENNRAHCLNKTAYLVWESCDGRRTIADISAQLSLETNAPFTDELVLLAVDKLARRHLLIEPFSPDKTSPRPTRREVLRKLGIGAAVAIPVITSIIAPRAVEAATCLESGAACTTSVECCSGICDTPINNTCI